VHLKRVLYLYSRASLAEPL